MAQSLQNADSDLMLARRIRRDIAERGRDVDGVLDQVSKLRHLIAAGLANRGLAVSTIREKGIRQFHPAFFEMGRHRQSFQFMSPGWELTTRSQNRSYRACPIRWR